MGPATDSLPKPMVPVGGKPLLEYLMGWLKRSGVTEAFMCLGYRADAIQRHFGDGSRWGVRLQYQIETEPRGTAGCVRDLGSRVREDLLVVYGDLFLDLDCERLLDFHSSHDGAATLVVRRSDHPHDSDLIGCENGRITRVYRAKEGEPFENLACAAVWVIRPELLELIPKDRPTDFGRDIFPTALAEGRKLMAYVTEEVVLDVGTPERVKAVEKMRPGLR